LGVVIQQLLFPSSFSPPGCTTNVSKYVPAYQCRLAPIEYRMPFCFLNSRSNLVFTGLSDIATLPKANQAYLRKPATFVRTFNFCADLRLVSENAEGAVVMTGRHEQTLLYSGDN
jgi:hypothetical protein